MKVALVCRLFEDDFVNDINEYIGGKKAVDIKLSMDGGHFVALIMYEEE